MPSRHQPRPLPLTVSPATPSYYSRCNNDYDNRDINDGILQFNDLKTTQQAAVKMIWLCLLGWVVENGMGEKNMIIFISVFYQKEIYNSLEANLGLNQGLCCDH